MMGTKNALSLTFMGSPYFAVPTLKAIISAGHKVKCVYTQPPRPAGRGQREQRSPVHVYADALEIEVRTPVNFCNPEEREAFAALETDAAVVVAYGLVISADMLAAPKLGCLNVHASLLPRWRGAAPIQRAILAGDVSTGITIMAMEEELDTGPIYAKAEVPITTGMTAQKLHDQLATLGGPILVKALSDIAKGRLVSMSQPESGITYAKKIEKDEGRIEWAKRSLEIERQVRGLNPWPGVWFIHNGERIKVQEAHLQTGEGQPGTVIKAPLIVACGEGSLCIDRLQRPGKEPMNVREYLRGRPIAVGTQLF